MCVMTHGLLFLTSMCYTIGTSGNRSELSFYKLVSQFSADFQTKYLAKTGDYRFRRIVVVGSSKSGKSTFIRNMIGETEALHISGDTEMFRSRFEINNQLVDLSLFDTDPADSIESVARILNSIDLYWSYKPVELSLVVVLLRSVRDISNERKALIRETFELLKEWGVASKFLKVYVTHYDHYSPSTRNRRLAQFYEIYKDIYDTAPEIGSFGDMQLFVPNSRSLDLIIQSRERFLTSLLQRNESFSPKITCTTGLRKKKTCSYNEDYCDVCENKEVSVYR